MASTPARGALRVLNVDAQSHCSTTSRRSVFKALPGHNRKYRRSLSLNDENRLCCVVKVDTCQSERGDSFKHSEGVARHAAINHGATLPKHPTLCQAQSLTALEPQLLDVKCRADNTTAVKMPGVSSASFSKEQHETQSHPAGMDLKHMQAELENFKITNSVLRDELNNVQHERDKLRQDVEILQSRLHDANNQTSRAVKDATNLLNTTVADLKSKNSQQLLQISNLEKVIASMKFKSDGDRSESSQELTKLRSQITQLQQDFSLSYRQKTEQAELCRKYQQEYHATLLSVETLQSQLAEFLHLKSSIEESLTVQQQVADTLKLAHVSVQELYVNTRAERDQLTIEKNALTQILAGHDVVVAECETFKLQKDAWLAKISTLDSMVQALQSTVTSQHTALVDKQRELDDLNSLFCATESKLHEMERGYNEMCMKHKLEIASLREKYQEKDQNFEDLSRQAERLQRLFSFNNTELTKLRADFAAADSKAKKLTSVEAQLRELLNEKEQLEQEKRTALQQRHETLDELQRIAIEKSSLENQLKTLEACYRDQNAEVEAQNGVIADNSGHLAELIRDLSVLNDSLEAQANYWSQLRDSIACSGNKTKLSVDPLSYSAVRQHSALLSPPGSIVNLVLSAAKSENSKNIHTSSSARHLPKFVRPQGVAVCQLATPSVNMNTPKTPATVVGISTPGLSAFRPVPPSGRKSRQNIDDSGMKTDRAEEIQLLSGRLNLECTEDSVVKPLCQSIRSKSAEPSDRSTASRKHCSVNLFPSRSVDSISSETSSIGLDLRSTGSADMRLSDCVTEASELVSGVKSTIKRLQGSILSAFSDLCSQIDLLREECQRKDTDIYCTREALQESQASLREATEHGDSVAVELESTKKERDNALVLCKEVQRRLAQNTDFSMQCMDQKTEIEKLKRDLALRESEVAALKETIQSRLDRLGMDSSQLSACLSEIVSENHRLKQDKTKLYNTLTERDISYTAESHNLREMYKATSANLKKKDLMIDHVRKALRPYAEKLGTDNVLTRFLETSDVDNYCKDIGELEYGM